MATPQDQAPEASLETRSRWARSSQLTTSSVAATRARAKAEAAIAQLSFAQKEAELLKEQAEQLKKKAELDADLHLLKSKKEVAAALAEAQAWEASMQENGDPQRSQLDSLPPIDPSKRTQDYVQQQAELLSGMQTLSITTPQPIQPPLPSVTNNNNPAIYDTGLSEHQLSQDFQPLPQVQFNSAVQQQSATTHPNAVYNPSNMLYSRYHTPYTANQNTYNQTRYPLFNVPTPRPADNSSADTSGLAKYLMRREMVSSGLLKFDDQPENYWAWKASFQSAVQELNLLPQEELDLLSKWLGPQSAAQAKRIRAAYVSNPMVGLHMVWQRLEDCFGAPEIIEHALLKKIEDFPKMSNRENQRLRELGDILTELQAAKLNGFLPGLSHLDTAHGVNPILAKLPYNLQERWVTNASRYKREKRVSYPPFSFFVDFINDEAKTRNDPSFACVTGVNTIINKTEKTFKQKYQTPVSVRKTDVAHTAGTMQKTNERDNTDPEKDCPLHHKPHPLRKCRLFRSKSLTERKNILKEKNICFRCCSSVQHMAKECTKPLKCTECISENHATALHPEPLPLKSEKPAAVEDHGGEEKETCTIDVTSKCTEVCGNSSGPRSCSKICLAKVFPAGQPDRAVKMYAVLDEQSNRSLARSDFFDIFGINAQLEPYTLKTCAGVMDVTGRLANNFVIESLDSSVQISLPALLECDMIPDDRSEIPSPELALLYPHLKVVVDKIPAIDSNADILLLLGRDILQVHKVREQHNGPRNDPYAQRLDLGWVIVGEVCLDKKHKPKNISVYRTNILQGGRATLLSPCENVFQVKEKLGETALGINRNMSALSLETETDNIGSQVFQKTRNDDKPALSIEDKSFLETLDQQVYKDSSNTWVAPLPFRTPRGRLPNNKPQAMKRLQSLQYTLNKKPLMKMHFIDFMQKMFDAGQAEPAPPLKEHQECWFLPMFGVYHPQKLDQIRVVFDSSAKYEGVSLNDMLLSGPDMNNTLLGVLIRFRKEPIAVTTDVQQMFYCFAVDERHRDYLRFLWFEDNDPQKPIREFRMTVHVFGNSPSPAIAIYCLRRAALEAMNATSETTEFITRNFYVDDGLASFPNPETAIETLQTSQEMLAESNVRLHKVASNSNSVMQAFPPSDRAKDLKDLDLTADPLPVQRSLGLTWKLDTDCFTFRVSKEDKPVTKRGILSTVNSLFDPLGFVAPVTLGGKLLMRDLSTEQYEWDDQLPAFKQEQWKLWKDSIKELEHLQIPRPYVPVSLSTQTQYSELCIFSDASNTAIAAVAFLKTVSISGDFHVGFIMGKSKLAPSLAHTIPRLELCAAVLAVEMADFIKDEMDIDFNKVSFYTDSKIVLGYIHNVSRRFYVYVSNRVARIRKSSETSQWRYINTEENPADHGTRPLTAAALKATNWFSGPSILVKQQHDPTTQTSFELVQPEKDQEIRPLVTALNTNISKSSLGATRFERFSTWKSLVRGVTRLIKQAKSLTKKPQTDTSKSNDSIQATTVIIKAVQHDCFVKELKCISKGEQLSKQSPLKTLTPLLDEDGLIRVGGRMTSTDLCFEEKHPVIIPKSHVGTLLVKHYHEQVAHQGRHFSEGAVRSAGLWLIGGKKLVSNVIHKCVICKKLRGKQETQQMSDLPSDRLTPEPPFTRVGLDVFGPWTVISRKTRGGHAESKRWAIIFSCLSSRAVHIEVIESMTTSSFINALRRFTALRGPVKMLRSDRGTNFIGACKELNLSSDDPDIQTYLQDNKCTWTFNPPHSSHMGGVWERMIGIARRILDALLVKTNMPSLTHEMLTTLMAEVTAIMNSRPLVPISSDPESPAVLTPSMLLTQKADSLSSPVGDMQDLSNKHWKRVQGLADTFWKRWRMDYLTTLQPRRKWTTKRDNVQVGDIVLLKDSQAKRMDWPLGLIVNVLPSQDNKVRKVEVKVSKQGVPKVYLRPISEVVLLFHKDL